MPDMPRGESDSEVTAHNHDAALKPVLAALILKKTHLWFIIAIIAGNCSL